MRPLHMPDVPQLEVGLGSVADVSKHGQQVSAPALPRPCLECSP